MFRDGKIKTYDSKRGMGTLELIGEAQDLSFEVQDLPSPEIEPQIGERLKFRIIPQQESMTLDNMVRLDIKVQDEFVQKSSPCNPWHPQSVFLYVIHFSLVRPYGWHWHQLLAL